MSRMRSTRRIWGAPVAIGGVSLVGLLAALLADGLGDVVSWIALAVPTVVCLWGLWPARRRPASGTSRRTGRSARRSTGRPNQ